MTPKNPRIVGHENCDEPVPKIPSCRPTGKQFETAGFGFVVGAAGAFGGPAVQSELVDLAAAADLLVSADGV
jgi:hypothetical protein